MVCREKDQWEYTVPYTPDQNGASERSIRTVMSET